MNHDESDLEVKISDPNATRIPGRFYLVPISIALLFFAAVGVITAAD